MRFIDLFICWMFGHEPYDAHLDLVLFDDDQLSLSYCERCGCTLAYSPYTNGWVKW